MKKDIIGTKINSLMSFSFIFILLTSFTSAYDLYLDLKPEIATVTGSYTTLPYFIWTNYTTEKMKIYNAYPSSLLIDELRIYTRKSLSNTSTAVADSGTYIINQSQFVGFKDYSFSGAVGAADGVVEIKLNQYFMAPNTDVDFNILYHYASNDFDGSVRVATDTSICPADAAFTGITTKNNQWSYQNLNECVNFTFNRILLNHRSSSSASTDTFYIEAINVSDLVQVSNNSLPTCDFNISKTMICLQNTTDIDLNIDCTDTEGDTIYYSLGQFDYLNRYVFQEEKFLSDDFFTEGRFSSNYSYQDDISDANYYINSYSFTPIQIIAGVSGTNVLVTDTDVSSWSYKLDYPINNLTTIDYDIGFNTNESIVNMYTYSDTGVQQSNISFEYIGGNISIYADGNLIKNKQYGRFSAGFDNYFNIVMLMYPDQNKYYLVVTDDDEQYTIWVNNTFTQDVRTIKFDSLIGDVTNEYYILANLEVKGWFGYGALSFSQTEPTINDIDFKTGKIKLYVSDSVHQPISYNQYETSITVTTSEKICGEDGNDNFGQVDDSILGAIKQFFRGLSDGAGTTSYFQDAIFYVFISMFVIIVISTKNMKLALTGASFVALLCSIVFGTITQILSYIIITAISTVYVLVSQ